MALRNTATNFQPYTGVIEFNPCRCKAVSKRQKFDVKFSILSKQIKTTGSLIKYDLRSVDGTLSDTFWNDTPYGIDVCKKYTLSILF